MDQRIPGILLFAATLWAVLAFLARQMIFHPMPYPDGDWDLAPSLGVEDVTLPVAGGDTLHAWWKPAPSAKFATLFLHGNAGNLTHRADIVQALPAAGSSVLLLDYRGYGKSTGTPALSNVVMDCAPAIAWLERKGFPPERIVLHGESLGTAVAMQWARQKPWAGVVLEAPFTSLSGMAGEVLPGLGRLLIWGLNSERLMPELRSPLLIIHGRNDEIVPFRMGERLYRLAPDPKQFLPVENAGHNDLRFVLGGRYREAMRSFYARIPVSGGDTMGAK